MQIIKLRQDFYRVTANVIASVLLADRSVTVYDDEMAFRMQPDITADPLLPLKPFCRIWERGQALGLPDGSSDLEKSLERGVREIIYRRWRTRLDEESVIVVTVEILEVLEQEDFQMEGLHPDFRYAVTRFFFNRNQ